MKPRRGDSGDVVFIKIQIRQTITTRTRTWPVTDNYLPNRRDGPLLHKNTVQRVSRTGPKQLRLFDVQFEMIGRHPVQGRGPKTEVGEAWNSVA